jgi:hypothetical protein
MTLMFAISVVWAAAQPITAIVASTMAIMNIFSLRFMVIA